MPRVHERKKAARGKPYSCSTCGKEIEAGQSFLYWSFRYGGTRRIHKDHGYPRRSQLTQSAMGEVYSAVEGLEDTLAGDWAFEDLESGVEEVKEIADQVRSQYEEAAEHFGGQGENQERAEMLEQFIDALDQVDLDDFDEGEAIEETRSDKPCPDCKGEGHAVVCETCGGTGRQADPEQLEEKRQEWRDEISGKVEEALSEAP